MTAVLAIDYFYQIIVIADCRVTWLTNPRKLQDNLQKVYPLGPTGVLGFAGGVAAAQKVINGIQKEASRSALPPTALEIANNISVWAQKSYSELPKVDKIILQLMYVAADYSHVTFVAPNATFARNILVKFVSPDFEPLHQSDFVALGYAEKYSPKSIRKNRDGMLNYGLDPNGRKFQIGISIAGYGEDLVKIANSEVGGLFSVGLITAHGVGWSSYSIGDQVKLEIENGGFVQYDLKDGRRIPLKAIWDFDARKPDAGRLAFVNRPPE